MDKRLAYSILTALAVCGCQVVEISETLSAVDPGARTFTAIIEDNASGGTRTSLDENGNVLWKTGDQVSIFEGSTINEQYQVSDDSDGKTSASLNKISGSGFVAGGEIENNVAFYPYAATATIARDGDSYVISGITLPPTQTYAEGSFGNGAFPMAAVTSSTDDMNLKFKNVFGGLKLQLKGTVKIASISITGRNNEILCGAAEVSVSNGSVPSITLTDATAKTVTLDCGEGVQLNAETATSFIIALPPMTMDSGFTVVVTDTEGKQMVTSTTKSQTINRSKLLKMPEVNFEATPTSPLTFESSGETSISLTQKGSPDEISLEFKVNDGEWASYSVGDAVALTDKDRVSFRAGPTGNSSFSKSPDDYYVFSVTGSGTVAASGNIMSLLSQTGSTIIPSSYCFYRLFGSCTGLTSAPDLPATRLSDHCYQSMFSYCTGLTAAPELPAIILTDHCYYRMFLGCGKLTSAPELPATTLADNCYATMFLNCKGLTSAPILPATTLTNYCYYSMFSGCTNLNYIKMLATDVSATDCLRQWVKGVASTGTFVKYAAASWVINGDDGVPEGWTVNYEGPSISPLTFESLGVTGISLIKNGDPDDISLEYKVNDGEWASYSVGDAIALTDGEKVSFRAGPAGNSSFSKSTSDYYSFSVAGSGTVAASGNIMSLLNRAGFSIIPAYCFCRLFTDCTGLAAAPELPALALADHCYQSMFSGCKNLVFAPELPATTIKYGCYQAMFSGCTCLVSAPVLPATALASSCYWCMFQGCTNLTTAPELPATSLASYCYGSMFSNCTSLTSAPELPATTLQYGCYYYMFSTCKYLTLAPELPATSIADRCYYGMFSNCTNLTSAPELPATILADDCYQRMFKGCTNLNYIKMLAIDVSATGCLNKWCTDVASSGTFVKNAAATWDISGDSGIPSDWTVITE